MPLDKTLYDRTEHIPQESEEEWAGSGTQVLADLVDGLEGSTGKAGAVMGLPKRRGTSLAVAAGATIPSVGGAVTSPMYLVTGSGGPVTLGAIAIANGSYDGQEVVIQGTSANTVTINNGSNTSQNGHVTLDVGEAICFRWSAAGAVWEELWRTT